MKQLTLILAALCLGMTALAQSTQPVAIVSGGGGYASGNIVLDWTIGQISYQTAEGTDAVLTQGFQQPSDFTTPVTEIPTDWGLRIFPNPASDRVSVDISGIPAGHSLTYQLIDLQGRSLQRGPLQGPVTNISVTDLSASLYFLLIMDDSGLLTTLKVVVQ